MSGGAKVLDLRGLSAGFDTPEGFAGAVDRVSFHIREKEIFCLVGESGCGKTATALAIMGLLPRPAGRVTGGQILLDGTDLALLSGPELRRIRGAKAAMIFQEPMTSLNPVFTVGSQVAEVFSLHRGLRPAEAREKTVELFRTVKIPEPEARFGQYPHELSGGMKQRVMIAMALACEPRLIIADEPTTALDATIQAEILSLLLEVRERFSSAVLLVTHNLGLVRQYADRIAVMYAGRIVETGASSEVLDSPLHPYTRRLLHALPGFSKRGKGLVTIPGTVPPAVRYVEGCRFFGRCPVGMESCLSAMPPLDEARPGRHAACFRLREKDRLAEDGIGEESPVLKPAPPLLEARGLEVFYPIRRGLLRRTVAHVRAVNGVDIEICRGKTLALVGESGCGKTTLGRVLVRLAKVHGGTLRFDGADMAGASSAARKEMHRRIQLVFQDPYSSLDPRMKVRDILAEGPRAHGLRVGEAELRELLASVSLDWETLARYPHEFSGGQRQRISIARALAMKPDLLICDEATSSLDVSVQAQILNILRGIQRRTSVAYLLITHDISVVEYMADNVAVMYLGRVVEQGSAEEVLGRPAHPYTRILMESVPRLEKRGGGRLRGLAGEVPSAVRPPDGCFFHTRCPRAEDKCRQAYPPAKELGPGHRSCCWFS